LVEKQKRESPIPDPEEKILESVEIAEYTKRLVAEHTYFIETKDGGAAIFKPERFHNTERERAAYIVDRFLGFNLVPPTVIRNVGGRTGSFQRFIPDAFTRREVPKDSISQEEFVKLALFDFLIDAGDRPGNFLIKDQRIIAIDNEISFCRTMPPTLRSLTSLFADGERVPWGSSIPAEIRNKIIQFGDWKKGKPLLRQYLKELFNKEREGKKEIDTFFKRLEYLVQAAKRGYFFTKEEYSELEF
jgi:hypothetical protein